RAGVLLGFPMDRSKQKIKAELFRLVDTWSEKISSMLHHQVIASVAVPVKSVKLVPSLFENALRGLRYRSLQHGNQALDMEELLPQSSHTVCYPFTTEKEIIQAVRLGLENEALEGIEQFMRD